MIPALVPLAFCGFFVSGADGKLSADATHVVLMREGTRTVLSMQNDYAGPLEDFALVVPVPVVLQQENVKTLPKSLFESVDALSAPRLVEYWEQDPCPAPYVGGDLKLGGGGGAVQGGSGGSGLTFGGGASAVRIEAEFAVGEYEILILSARDSGGLDGWLRGHGYKLPEGTEPALRPYVAAGSKFFVAKVDVKKVKLDGGRAQLSPLRFHYDSETFSLPVRLGMLSSSGTQDLVVHILAPAGQRYDVKNYPAVTIPTNLDVSEAARKDFRTFYAALFDKTLEKNPRAVVTEYAWGAQSCDPCPSSQSGLTAGELTTLGADVLPSTRIGPLDDTPTPPRGAVVRVGAIDVKGTIPGSERVVAGLRARFRSCYQTGVNNDPSMAGSLVLKVAVSTSGEVASADVTSNAGVSPGVAACVSGVVRRATFAPGGGTITIPLTLGADVPMPVVAPPVPRPPRIGVQSIGSGFTLTRLHARYGRGALADDLVFAAAEKIVGGREERGATGELETGAKPASMNAFQARYAIRHTWNGPIACEHPQRGVWGGPWPDAGAPSPGTAIATKLAYAPRGGTTLASFVPNGIPEQAPATSPSSPDGGTTAPRRVSACGCDVLGAREDKAWFSAGLAFVALAITAARRRRSPAS